MNRNPLSTAIVLLVMIIVVAIVVPGCATTIDNLASERSKPIYVKGTVYRW